MNDTYAACMPETEQGLTDYIRIRKKNIERLDAEIERNRKLLGKAIQKMEALHGNR